MPTPKTASRSSSIRPSLPRRGAARWAIRRRGGLATVPAALAGVTAVAALLVTTAAHAGKPVGVPGALSLTVEIGPLRNTAPTTRTLVFDQAARKQVTWFDVQDGYEHNVRGLPLRDVISRAKPPKSADAVVFSYADGMEIPLRLDQKDEVDSIFVALEHGNVRDDFSTTYTLHNQTELPCPKILYGRKVTSFSIWIYPGALTSIRLVNWKTYETRLAQPTRRVPDSSGWPIYMRHCQSCHGIGGQGAKRGPDFLTDMGAYRRIPPLAVTDISEHPSLHEKVKGFAEGQMPVLTQISNAEIATVWRWLHAIHNSATK